MNKYQRKNSKRMKKLATLGIPYFKQKKFIKIFKGNLDKLDEAIADMEEIQKSTIFKRIYEKVSAWGR